jgi:hypothetical protein
MEMKDLDDIIDAHCSFPQKEKIQGECPGCHEVTTLVLTPSMTQYEDPERNLPFYACKWCSEEYIEEMQDRWNDYYAGLL